MPKVSTRYEFPDGSKVFEKHVYKDPTKYFTHQGVRKMSQGKQKLRLRVGGKMPLETG